MSKETLTDLNQQTLIGYTDKRGSAWHYRADEQGAESNHYEGAIPVEDVHRRLFDWTAIEAQVTASATIISDDGVTDLVNSENDFKAILRSDTAAILGIFKSGYQPHQYGQWLLDNVEAVLGNSLHVGSAGLLKGGAQAWVQIEMEDTLESHGVKFRPFLTAATSLDGSLATTYLTGAQVVVCDNTLSAALSGKSNQMKIQHSRYSLAKIDEIREGLGLVEAVAADFEAQLDELTSKKVTENRWTKFLDALVPIEEIDGKKPASKVKKQAELRSLWTDDERVAPWKNTEYGVLAAVNTWEHHLKSTSGATKGDRNVARLVSGGVDKLDISTMQLLSTIR